MFEVAVGEQTVGRKKFLCYFPSSEVVWDVRRRAKLQEMWMEWRKEIFFEIGRITISEFVKMLEILLGQARVF